MAITPKLEMAGQGGVLAWGRGGLGDALPGLHVDPTCTFKITVWPWLYRRQSENPERIASEGIKSNFKHFRPASRHLPDGIQLLSGDDTGVQGARGQRTTSCQGLLMPRRQQTTLAHLPWPLPKAFRPDQWAPEAAGADYWSTAGRGPANPVFRAQKD